MAFFKDLKERFIRRVEKEYSRQREEEVKNSTAWHSRAYHRYYEGWSESYTLDPATGQRRISRVYTGRFYVQDLSGTKRLIVKITYSILFLAAAVLFFTASMADWVGNLVWYVVLPHAFCFGSLAYMLIVLTSYVPAPQKMKIHEYRATAKPMRRAALFGTVSHALACAAALAYTLAFDGADAGFGITVRFLLAAGALLTIFLIERGIEYDSIDNPASHGDNGTQIQ